MALLPPRPLAWPRLAGWLTPGEDCTALGYAIVTRAMQDIGIVETPLGSNRGGRIDAMALRAGSPLGSWWCAIWAGAVLQDCSVSVPAGYPSTDAWLSYLVPKPSVGDAVLYGVKGNAHHIGIVVRLDPLVLTIEGNRAFAGSSNNGVAVDLGPMLRRDILGYYPSNAHH